MAMSMATRTAAPGRMPGRRRVVEVAARKSAGKAAKPTPKPAPKKSGPAAEAYICLDCGWVYTGQKGPFEKLPENYRCPVCNSPKRRFVTKNPKAAGRGGGSSGEALLNDSDTDFAIKAAAGAAFLLAAMYLFLNSQVS